MTTSNSIILGPGPVVIPIEAYFQAGMQSIVEAQNKNDFHQAFDIMFAKDAEFELNGVHVSRLMYEAELMKQSAAAPNAAGASFTMTSGIQHDDSEYRVSGIPVSSFIAWYSSSKTSLLIVTLQACRCRWHHLPGCGYTKNHAPATSTGHRHNLLC